MTKQQFLFEVPEEEREGELRVTITRLLVLLGEDVTREGLRDTPARVAKAWQEWTSGYAINPAQVLKSFADGAPENSRRSMVIVSNIPVVSRCEHHLAEISGIAHVGYLPNGRVVGLSKLARVVDAYARRLQVQERLTDQIATTVEQSLGALGVGVLIRARHGCMASRGVRIHGSITTTSSLRGAFMSDPTVRAEFLNLCRDAETGNV